MSMDGSTSISNHCDIYIPVQQVLWRWRWSQCRWPRASKFIASITTRTGKIYFLVIWKLPNHCRFCSFALPFHELWHILQGQLVGEIYHSFLGLLKIMQTVKDLLFSLVVYQYWTWGVEATLTLYFYRWFVIVRSLVQRACGLENKKGYICMFRLVSFVILNDHFLVPSVDGEY